MKAPLLLVMLLLLSSCGQTENTADQELGANCSYVSDMTSPQKKVCYENKNGLAVIEGDIVLGTIEEMDEARAQAERGSRNSVARAAGGQRRWPGGIIPYRIEPGLTNPQRIYDVINYYAANTNIRLVPQSTEPNFVTFKQVPGVCNSYVGVIGGEQSINLDPTGCLSGQIAHEVLHAIGMYHEQSREDRDNFVVVHRENSSLSQSDFDVNFGRQIAFAQDLGSYDFDSIMHYGPFFFSKQPGVLPTITKLDGTTTGFGQQNVLSAGDLANLADLYSADFIETPSDLTARALSKTVIQVDFADNSSNEAGFHLERALSPAGPWHQFTLSPASGLDTLRFDIPGHTAGTSYFFRVRSFNSTRNSNYSSQYTVTTLPNAPVAPSNLQATAVSHSRVQLTWSDNSDNESYFRVERALSVSGPWDIARAQTASTLIDEFRQANTTYYYRVIAVNGGGDSEFSDVVSVTTPNQPVPLPPSDLSASIVTATAIDLVWKDNSSDETGFAVHRSPTLTDPWVEVGTVGAGLTTFRDGNLTSKQTYFYRVVARNGAGSSAPSNVAQSRTEIPAAPSSLTIQIVSPTSLTLSWNDNSNNEASFEIWRQVNTSSWAKRATVNRDVTTYSDPVTSSTARYYYRVKAVNPLGSSAFSNTVNAKPVVPVAPTSVLAKTISVSQINLTWAHSGLDLDGFKIERKVDIGGTYQQVALLPASARAYPDSGLTEDVRYYYRVLAYNGVGNSPYGAQVNAITQFIPSGPSNLVALVTSQTRFDLTWNDNSGNESAFEVWRKINSGAWAKIATVESNTADYSDVVTYTPSTTYSYEIRAANSAGLSAFSNIATARAVVPAAPTGFRVSRGVPGESALRWTHTGVGVSGFRIERRLGVAGVYQEVAELPRLTRSHADTGLLTGQEYYYRIRAYNGIGFSPYSTAVKIVAP